MEELMIVENIEKLNISKSIPDQKRKFIENFEKMYHDKNLSNFILTSRKNVVNQLIEKLTIYSESNDIDSFNKICEEITFLKHTIYTHAEIEIFIQNLETLISKNYQDLNLLVKPFTLLNKCLTEIKDKSKLKLNWKIYFKIFFILNGHPCYEFSYMTPILKDGLSKIQNFFGKCNKFFKIELEEDINFLREEIIRNLFSGSDENLVYALKLIHFFYPKNKLQDDQELQKILHKIMVNKNHYAMMIFLILKKVINFGLKLDASEFIDNFFNILNNYITKGIQIGQGFTNKKKKGKILNGNKNYDKTFMNILGAFLFSEKYLEFRESSDKHFTVLLNLINYNLKENSTKDVINFNLNFLKSFLTSVKEYTFKKEKKQNEEFVEENQEFILLKEQSERLKLIMKWVEPLIIKSLFYDEKVALGVLSESQKLMNSFELTKNILETLYYIFENSEINFTQFINKINIFLKCFLNINNFISNKEIFNFLEKVIKLSIDKISSVSLDMSMSILTLFSNFYLIVHNLKNDLIYLNSSNFSNLIHILNNSCILITKKIVGLFQMFSASKKYETLQLFFMSANNFIDDIIVNEMVKIFVNYAEENIIEKSDLSFYFRCFKELKLKNTTNDNTIYLNKNKLLWNYCYSNLLRCDKNENNIEIANSTKFTIYNYKLNQNYQIDIFNDKKLKYIKNLLRSLFYNEIEVDEKFKSELFNLLFVLLNENDIKYQKVALVILNRIIDTKLTPFMKLQNNSNYIITYPNTNDISLIIELYNIFVLPTLENLKNVIDTLNINFNNHLQLDHLDNLNDKDKKKIAKKWIKSQEGNFKKELLEKNILLFLKLENCFSKNLENPFLLNHNVKSKIQPELNSDDINITKNYENLKQLRNSLIEFHFNIYESFISFYNLDKNLNINKFYTRGIINQVYNSSNTSNLLNQTTKTHKIFKKILKNLTKKEKSILNYFEQVESFVSHLRLFKINRDSDKNKLIPNLKLLAKLYISTNDKKINSILNDYLKNSILYHKFNKKELNSLYEEINKNYLRILSKIKNENNLLLISDKTKIVNIFNFYTSFIKNFNLVINTAKINIIENSINLIASAIEKKFTEILITSKNLFSELTKIKFEFPKNENLIQKKLQNFPFINKLDKLNNNLKRSKKFEKIVTKNCEKINKNLTKVENNKNKIILKLKQFFNNYYLQKLNSDKKVENMHVSYMLNIYVILSMIFVLNLNNSDDFILFSKYEEYFYRDIISDSIYIQKRMSFIIWGLILRIKHKISKENIIIELSDEEYKNKKNEIIFSTKDNISGLSEYNIKYLKASKLLENQNLNNSNMIKSLNSEKDFVKLIDSLIFLKDSINDQSLMKSNLGSILNINLDSFDYLNTFVNYLQNPHNKFKISSVFFAESLVTQNLFDAWESNISFYIFQLYNLNNTFNYEKILSIFEDKIKKSEKEKLVPISVLLHILAGMIKNDLKLKNYSEIRKNVFAVMKYYTNNINKRIDNDILKYFSFIIENLTLNDFLQIFFDDNKFVLLNYDQDFILIFLNIITKHFSLKSQFIFSNEILFQIDSIINNYLSDKEKLVKNLNTLKISISSYILLSNNLYYNFKDFEFIYDLEKSQNYFNKLLKLSKSTEIKEMKQICSFLVFMYKRYFIFQPDLLIEYLLEISKVTYLDIEDFEKHLNFLRVTFQFPCYKIKIGDYLNHIETKLNSLDNLHSRKFFVDLLTNLFRSNLNNYNTPNNYEESLKCISNMIRNSQYEIKDYIVNNLMIYFIHSLDDEVNKKIIENLKSELITINKENTNLSNNYSLSIIFILGTYLKSFYLEIPENIQNLIIFLKEINIKIFKNRGAESKLIKSLIAEFFNKYKYTYNYAKRTMSSKCDDAIIELSRTKSYFL